MLQWHSMPLAICAPGLQFMLSKDSLQRTQARGAFFSERCITFLGNSSQRRVCEWLNDKIAPMSFSTVKP